MIIPTYEEIAKDLEYEMGSVDGEKVKLTKVLVLLKRKTIAQRNRQF